MNCLYRNISQRDLPRRPNVVINHARTVAIIANNTFFDRKTLNMDKNTTFTVGEGGKEVERAKTCQAYIIRSTEILVSRQKLIVNISEGPVYVGNSLRGIDENHITSESFILPHGYGRLLIIDTLPHKAYRIMVESMSKKQVQLLYKMYIGIEIDVTKIIVSFIEKAKNQSRK